jgi:hypothetical protein
LKLRVVSRASQSAFAVIVNASVDLLIAFLARKHFVNHSSALHARYALVLAARPIAPLPAVNPEATVKFTLELSVVAVANDGTDEQVVLAPA